MKPDFQAEKDNVMNLNVNGIPSYTIDQLDFIITNYQNHSSLLVNAAKERLRYKLQEWRDNNQRIVNELDNFIRHQGWYDFQMWSYDSWNLIIGGSYDLTYYHTLEITFSQTFFVSGFFQSWNSDTNNPVIEMIKGELENELNRKYEIEQYHQLFIIRTEDYKNDIIIASRGISYETDMSKMNRKKL